MFLVAGCSSPEEKAQRYYERGTELLSKQDYVKAGIEFKNAVQNKKDLVGAWRGLLEVEVHNNNVPGQVAILRTIVELDPKDVASKLKLGHYLLVGGDVDQALDLANAAIALDGRNPNPLALKAAALLKLKDATGAKREGEAALAIDPANAEAAIVLAVERMIRGDTDGALMILDRPGITYKSEDEFAIQIVKLQIFEKSGDLKRQEVLLRKLVDLYPFETALQRTLINLYVKEKRYDDGEKELRAFAAAHPADTAAGLNVVRFLYQFRGPAAARQELMARIKTGGQVFQYQLALVDMNLAENKIADSIQLLESLVSNAGAPEDVWRRRSSWPKSSFSRRTLIEPRNSFRPSFVRTAAISMV